MDDRDVLREIFDVRGVRAVVTGAASGLGNSMATALASCGAMVTLVDVNESTLEVAVKTLADQGFDVSSAVADVTDADGMETLLGKVAADKGGLDVVFANAGGGSPGSRVAPEDAVLERYPPPAWRSGLQTNLFGAFATLRAAAGIMRPQRSGRIILTASTAGLRPDPYTGYNYVAAKAAVVNLVRQAALDLAPYQVRVNAIAPGPFRTNIGGPRGNDPEVVARWARTVPLGRMGDPRELRGLALLLASPASSFMTGAVYPIDGGALALSQLN